MPETSESRIALRHRQIVMGLLAGFAAACGDKPAARTAANDPSAPAVVRAPKLVLPDDTAKVEVPPAPAVTVEGARTHLASDFAVLGAAISFGDRRMIGSAYAPDAQMTTPDSVLHGAAAISGMLAQLGRDKSLKEFVRRSAFTRVVDSTVVDSGLYTIVTKRVGADSILESGRYATTWRIRPSPDNWVIVRDRLYRQSARRGK